MEWFSGDISAAINLAKTKNAIFVVYCEGKEENSTNFTNNYINHQDISSKLKSDYFVAIKIESDKPEYIQFCKIYQLVPVPSLFFIKNGIPIKVVTSAAKSLNEVIEAIDDIIKGTSNSSEIQEEAPKSNETVEEKVIENKEVLKIESNIVCDGDKCYKKEPENSGESTSSQADTSVETEFERQEKIKKAMKLIEEKRIERIKEEQRLEQEREIRRRKEGQQLQDLKKWQEDQELQQLKDERKREKKEAMEARRRVLEQIEEDKKERARKFNQNLPASQPETSQKSVQQESSVPITPSDSAKIQFKKPDGESEIVTFDADMIFGDLYSFVKTDILQGSNIKEFTLATTFPRREFSSDDFGKTLLDLNLTPSSVLLIIPGNKSSQNKNAVLPTETDGSFFDMISALIMGLISPLFAFLGYIKNIVFNRGIANNDNDAGKRKRDEESLMANDAAKKRNMSAYNQPLEPSTSSSETGTIPKSSTYKRVNPSSNIHRLHQDSEDSEDDERKTYNGNSTQQM